MWLVNIFMLVTPDLAKSIIYFFNNILLRVIQLRERLIHWSSFADGDGINIFIKKINDHGSINFHILIYSFLTLSL